MTTLQEYSRGGPDIPGYSRFPRKRYLQLRAAMPKASPPQHCCATNSAPTHDWRCRNCRKRDKWSNYKRSKKWCVKNCAICSAALESRASRRAATATSQAAAASAASLASQGLGRQPRKGRKRAASTQYKRVYGDGASVVATWPLHFMSQGAEHL